MYMCMYEYIVSIQRSSEELILLMFNTYSHSWKASINEFSSEELKMKVCVGVIVFLWIHLLIMYPSLEPFFFFFFFDPSRDPLFTCEALCFFISLQIPWFPDTQLFYFAPQDGNANMKPWTSGTIEQRAQLLSAFIAEGNILVLLYIAIKFYLFICHLEFISIHVKTLVHRKTLHHRSCLFVVSAVRHWVDVFPALSFRSAWGASFFCFAIPLCLQLDFSGAL